MCNRYSGCTTEVFCFTAAVTAERNRMRMETGGGERGTEDTLKHPGAKAMISGRMRRLKMFSLSGLTIKTN